MSAWADLAGDDSNLSMAADEFVGLSVLQDISNSVSQNRSRFDPELDSSKQGLNRQLKMFGLGNNSNSGLSKKRPHSNLQEEDDADMPPKSKQRTGPSDFSRFLEPAGTSSTPDLSSISSSSNASANVGSFGSVSSPRSSVDKMQGESLYAAVIGKGRSSSCKRTPQSSSSSRVPGLISQSTTATTTTNPTPRSSKKLKIGSSVPTSVRKKRLMMMRRRKGKSVRSPTKSTEPTGQGGDRGKDEKDDVCMERGVDENVPPSHEQKPQPMDEDGEDTREAFKNGLSVLKTEGNGRIYVPRDILQTTEKQANLPRPSPFRLMRSKSADQSGSVSPTKLNFSEESSPFASVGMSRSSSSPLPIPLFNMFNFMPLPIPSSSFGLISEPTSNAETPENEQVNEIALPSPIIPVQLPALPFIPFQPLLPMDSVPPLNPDQTTTEMASSSTPTNLMFGSFVPMPLPMVQIPSIPSSFVPFPQFVVTPTMPPMDVTTPIQPITPAVAETTPPCEEGQTNMDEGEKESAENNIAAVDIPPASVWAAPVSEIEHDGKSTWAKTCFRHEVKRNKVLKTKEDAVKVQRRKIEMMYKQREKELLPIENVPNVKLGYNGSYGTDKKERKWRRDYHPYEPRDSENVSNNVRMDRRMRGRARTRSLSKETESPYKRVQENRKNSGSTSDAGTTVTSPNSGSVSVSVEPRELPKQDPEPLTVERIAWRQKQIEMAKNTSGYKNFVAQIPKSQRRLKHPSTPNAKLTVSKRRWIGKYKAWRKQLHEFDDKVESMDVDEEKPNTLETTVPDTIDSSPFPNDADVEAPSAPKEEEE